MTLSTKGLISSLALLTAVLATSSSYADDTVNIPHVGKVPKKTLEIAGGTTAGVAAAGAGAYLYNRYRRPTSEDIPDQSDAEWLRDNYHAWGAPSESSPPWTHEQYENYRGTQPDGEPDPLTRPAPSQTPAELASATGHDGFSNGNEAAIRGDTTPYETGPASDDFRSGYDWRAGRTAAISGAKAPTAGIDSTRLQLGYHTGTDDTTAASDYHNGVRQRLADETSARTHNATLEELDTDLPDGMAGIRLPDEEPIRTEDLKPPTGANDDFRAGYYTSEDNLSEYEEGLRRAANDLPIQAGTSRATPNPHRTLGYDYQESGMTTTAEPGINSLDTRATDLHANASERPRLRLFSDNDSSDTDSGETATTERVQNAERALHTQQAEPTETAATSDNPIGQTIDQDGMALSNNVQFVTDNSRDAGQAIAANDATVAADNADASSTGSGDGETGDGFEPEVLPE
jgi:hypothetical protein